VLAGSLRAAPGALDLALHLIDARDGVHVWSRQQRCTPLEPSGDEAALLCAWMRPYLARHELARARRIPDDQLAAWQCHLLAHAYALELTPSANVRARELLERAVELEPCWALPAALLAATHFREIRNQWTSAPERSLEALRHWVGRALALDAEDPSALVVSSDYWSLLGVRARALDACVRAVEAAPGWFGARQALGDLLAFSGAPEEALHQLELACALAPGDPRLYAVHHGCAAAQLALGHYGDAVASARESLRLKDDPLARGLLVVALALHGELREAARERRLLPPFSERELCRLLACADPDFLERVLEGLRLASAAALCDRESEGDALRRTVGAPRRSLAPPLAPRQGAQERRLGHALEESAHSRHA
jgi:adenylate cyclase